MGAPPALRDNREVSTRSPGTTAAAGIPECDLAETRLSLNRGPTTGYGELTRAGGGVAVNSKIGRAEPLDGQPRAQQSLSISQERRIQGGQRKTGLPVYVERRKWSAGVEFVDDHSASFQSGTSARPQELK